MGRTCVEACLDDGAVYVATPALSRSSHLTQRVLPSIWEASRRALALGDADAPEENTLNGLLARPYAGENRREWEQWRVYVSGGRRTAR
jgi:hypothetical protein